MMGPLFSVIVPTHKRSQLLRRALLSITSQGMRSALEVVVVSDVSDSDTDAVCAELLAENDIYVKRNGSPGPSESRNLGMSMAKGRYILFLDDDDAWHDGFLSQVYDSRDAFETGPVYCDCSVVQERRLSSGVETLSEARLTLAGAFSSEVYVKNQVHMSCFVFPRDLLDGLRFDAFMRAYEDWDFLLSVFDLAMPSYLPILGSRVFEVPDETTDRRGASQKATDFNAVLDYLYVYRRHPAPDKGLKEKRAALLALCGMNIAADYL